MHFAMTEEMQLPARLENLPQFLEFVAYSAVLAGFDDQRVRRIRLAAEEVFINVVRYAYPEGEGEVRVVCSAHDDCLNIAVTDGGIAFNPLAFPAPTEKDALSERAVGGLGIHLVRQLADEVTYLRNTEGNHLTLIFRRSDQSSHA